MFEIKPGRDCEHTAYDFMLQTDIVAVWKCVSFERLCIEQI